MTRSGGFKFPEFDEKGGTLDGTLVDSDNVQLCQRKNQLSRRLRLARQAKARSGGPDNGSPRSRSGVKKGKKVLSDAHFAVPTVEAQHLSAQARVQMQMLLQHSQRSQQGCAVGNDTCGDKKRKAEGGEGVLSAKKQNQAYKRVLSLSENDEVRLCFFCLSACQMHTSKVFCS